MIQLNRILEKAMPFITPASVIIGVLLADFLTAWIVIVPWLFAFITLSSSLGVRIEKLKKAIMNPKPLVVALFIIQVIIPLIAYIMGNMMFPNDPLTVVGIMIAFVIPTGVASLIWVSIYQGNASMSLLTVIVNTMLAPFIIPLSLELFVGANVEINILSLMTNLLIMIVIPSAIGIGLNYIPMRETVNLKATLSPLSKICLILVITINSSVVAPFFKNFDWKVVAVALFVLLIASSAYVVGFVIGKVLKLENDLIISLVFHSGMRNISVGATIAIIYFPAAVSLPIVLGTLFQQTLAAVYGNLLHQYLYKEKNVTQTQ
ncbi:bile acid:sodium symporter family protein [Halalkalibacter urbisdiaboli]|uniref:bile acid:sodium symporter family protein n=1 Tax=Halalkalibacter urbisdiaboli TaxID=1960589 RepID=UPI000B42CF67|nr:bile acid:sodium symporter family protein [Halalkalibacter urbisdiaboli]